MQQDLDSPEKIQQAAVAKAQAVYPDMSIQLGRLWGWTNPDGEDIPVHGQYRQPLHADCQSPGCNKRTLHRMIRYQWDLQIFKGRWYHSPQEAISLKGGPAPPGGRPETLERFNKKRKIDYEKRERTRRWYPKDRGLSDERD